MIGDIQVKEFPSQLVFSSRGKTTIAAIAATMAGVFGRMFPYIMSSGESFSGPPMAIYHEMSAGADGTADVEICVPLCHELPAMDEMSTRTLEAVTGVSAVYQGPYQEIGPAYEAIRRWITDHGYVVTGAPREIYLNSPDEVQDPADYLTEVVFPVKIAS